jgi:putative transposase
VSNRVPESNLTLKNLDGLSQGVIRQHFALKRHLLRASLYRKQLADRFAAWHRFTELSQNPFGF